MIDQNLKAFEFLLFSYFNMFRLILYCFNESIEKQLECILTKNIPDKK